MQPVSAAMTVFHPLCGNMRVCIDLRFIDVVVEIVIVYAWTHDLWFRVAYAFVLFSFDATVAFVAAIHGVRHAGGHGDLRLRKFDGLGAGWEKKAAIYCLKAMG
ncbi:hypothetical protein Tco_0623908 [Tanacetum coccineum]|uniref:Uncharacterized protein n=1 Tax=Tanacetum coccineum TaxID=301880 RepID=A0ABQ4WCI1_9ASTR